MPHAVIDPSATRLGARLFERGRALVAAGLRLDAVAWDADEVLWDWVMSMAQMGRTPHRRIFFRDFGHREYLQLKPGIFELLLGMQAESLERGLDPHMRVWTNGYPWRMWQIGATLPELSALLGPPAQHDADDHGDWIAHPRLFCRTDFADAIQNLLDEPAAKAGLPDALGEMIDAQVASGKPDSSLKVPELAPLVAKPGFDAIRILVDDTGANVRRFVRSAPGRQGVRVRNPTPRILRGKVPNTVWGDPYAALDEMAVVTAESIADALEQLVADPESTVVEADGRELPDDYELFRWNLDIPDARLRAEWIDPLRRVKALLKTL